MSAQLESQDKHGASLVARILILSVLIVLAFSTRLLPLSISSYPYNNDGMTEARVASDILASGHLEYPEGAFYVDTHSTITPIYNVVLAFVSSATGASPFLSAQSIIASLSVLTITCVYVLAFYVTKCHRSALTSALVVSLLGTFVFLTGSTWKESLGTCLLVLLIFAYSRRSEPRFLALEALIIITLPLVHHLVTVLALFALAFMTMWSVFFGRKNNCLKRRHAIDVIVVGVPTLFGYLYYSSESLDRMDVVVSPVSLSQLLLSFAIMGVATVFVLRQSTHMKFSFAPLVALAIFLLFVLDYIEPLFPYEPISPIWVLVLGGAFAAIVCIGWYGIESAIESDSRFRAIPLGLMMPVITLILFALMSGFTLQSQQILYRSFDFADIALALGVGSAVFHLRKKPRLAGVAIAALTVALLVSLPFSYATQPLLGLRHDSQRYEVDAIYWTAESLGNEFVVESDERLSYDARALADYEKKDFLPDRLSSPRPLLENTAYLYEEEWTTVGVNDYPDGRPVLNPSYVSDVLEASDVVYVGGPDSNSIVIFLSSSLGEYVLPFR